MQPRFVVVGQGLAGSLLAWRLYQRGENFIVFDPDNSSAASTVSSGIMNPITGKRFLKTWLADELFPLAKATYCELEVALGTSFFRELPLLKIVEHIQEQNDLAALATEASYTPFFTLRSFQKLDEEKVANPHGCLAIGGCAKLDVAVFLKVFRSFLKEKKLLREEFFTVPMALDSSDKIIYCDGAAAATSAHFFSYLPWLPAKGEYLLLHIPDFFPDYIVKGATTISPTAEKNIYYAGATYEWNFPHANPTPEKRAEITQAVSKMLSCNFEIAHHGAGIRPALQGRKPFVGIHPKYTHIFSLNGMGTKGVSLAPYFATKLTNLVTETKAT